MTFTVTMSVRERFEAKYIPEPMSGCWLWIGAMDTPGYGQMRVGDRGRRASHVSLELAGRPLIPGQHALHKCDVSLCVNPDHLYGGTRVDNMRDKLVRGRERGPTARNRVKTHCKRGHALEGWNLYQHIGRRHCRACRTQWKRDKRASA